MRAQIEHLLAESSQYKIDAFKELVFAAGAAIAVPPVALFTAYEAVEGFKGSARDYVRAIGIEKDAQRLLEMESSLEKARSFGGRE